MLLLSVCCPFTAEAEAESASPPADDSQNKAKEAEPVKTDEPGRQISDGTAEESPQNENNSNNSDVMQRKGDMSDREAAVKSFGPRQLKVQGHQHGVVMLQFLFTLVPVYQRIMFQHSFLV